MRSVKTRFVLTNCLTLTYSQQHLYSVQLKDSEPIAIYTRIEIQACMYSHDVILYRNARGDTNRWTWIEL